MDGRRRAMTREQATAAIAEGIRACTRCRPGAEFGVVCDVPRVPADHLQHAVLADLAAASGCSSTFTPRISSDCPLVGQPVQPSSPAGGDLAGLRRSMVSRPLDAAQEHTYAGGEGGHGGRRPSRAPERRQEGPVFRNPVGVRSTGPSRAFGKDFPAALDSETHPGTPRRPGGRPGRRPEGGRLRNTPAPAGRTVKTAVLLVPTASVSGGSSGRSGTRPRCRARAGRAREDRAVAVTVVATRPVSSYRCSRTMRPCSTVKWNATSML
jgi:hypothetical protein